MAKRPQCKQDADQIHQGYAPTGQSKPPSHPGGKRWEVWKCQCGEKKMDVIEGTKQSW
jgi:hypothetical protein